MTFIGIDPGAAGAVAFIYANNPGGTVNEVEVIAVDAVAGMLGWASSSVAYAVIERGHAMPRQGGTSMFTFGKNCGRVIGWFEVLGIPFQEVSAVAWQKVMLAGEKRQSRPERKASSIKVAQRLFPGVDLTLGVGKKPKDGASDALLIAEFARRTWKGGG